MKYLNACSLAIFLLLIIEKSQGQDLDPRAYARIPVRVTVIVAGFSYSDGGIVTDATLPVQDLNAKIGAPITCCCSFIRLTGTNSPGLGRITLCLGKSISNYCR